jgi:multiple sugar transport system permease protein
MSSPALTSRLESARLTSGPRIRTIAWANLGLYALLIPAALFALVPFAWMLSTSLKPNDRLLAIPPELWPTGANLASYQRVWAAFPLPQFFANSLIVAVGVTLGQLVTCSMAAYAFARLRWRGRELVFLLYLATLMVPFQVTVTPLFILMRYLNWVNTYQGLIAPGVFSAFGTFLLRQFFLTLPRELEEAAFLDGASHLTVFRRILLPLTGPGLATLSVFAFMGAWNSFLWPLVVVKDQRLMTLPLGLATLQGQFTTEWNLVMAGAVITVVPMLVLYLFAQRTFQKGVVLSGLKG